MIKTGNQAYIESYGYRFCNLASDKYDFTQVIGEGTYGKVFKAKIKDGTNKIFALKQLTIGSYKEGFPLTALREIKILKSLAHENIVRLVEICRSQAHKYNDYCPNIYLVLEYCEFVLSDMVYNLCLTFSLGEVKTIFKQIFGGLFYIHVHKILHRDLKSSNVLINGQGVVKIVDFGLARNVKGLNCQQCRHTNRVVSNWYKAPELLLGDTHYGPAIDVWSAGCMLAEMSIRSPLFQGDSEQSVLKLISNLCGSVSPIVWPDVVRLPLYDKINLPRDRERKLNKSMCKHVKDPLARDLIDKLLTLDPSKRISDEEVLDHDFFWKGPLPEPLYHLLGRFRMIDKSRKVYPGERKKSTSFGLTKSLLKRSIVN